jgi:hypothetical protein
MLDLLLSLQPASDAAHPEFPTQDRLLTSSWQSFHRYVHENRPSGSQRDNDPRG